MKNGYIALISVILVSAILLTVALEASSTSLTGRFNILTTQQKAESLNLAKSCLEIVLIRLAQNQNFRPSTPETISLGEESCQILSIETVDAANLKAKTQAIVSHATTNLSATINLNSEVPKIISIEETAN